MKRLNPFTAGLCILVLSSCSIWALDDLTEFAANIRPSIVTIKHQDREGNQAGHGTGFIIGTEGLIATCLHVIEESRPVEVTLENGQSLKVTRILAWDRNWDLAILEVDARDMPVIQVEDTDPPIQGEPVMAIGNPFGLDRSLVNGVVSAVREIDGIQMIQVSMPVEPGISGSPLFDREGKVVGILSLKSLLARNTGFAVPIEFLQKLIQKPNPVPIERWTTIGSLSSASWDILFGSQWSQSNGEIRVSDPGDGFGGRSLCLSKSASPKVPYQIRVDVKLEEESGAAGLAFHSDGGNLHYGFYPTAGKMRLTRFDGPTVYQWNILSQTESSFYKPGDWNRLRVQVGTNQFRCYLNGQLVFESEDQGLTWGRVGMVKFRDTHASFRNFRISSNLSETDNELNDSTSKIEQWLQQIDFLNVDSLDSWLEQNDVDGEQAAEVLIQQSDQLRLESMRLKKLAEQLQYRTILNEFKNLRFDDSGNVSNDSNLAEAMFLVSKLDHPQLDTDIYLQQIHDMAGEIRARFNDAMSHPEKLEILKDYLFNENGFHGSRSEYYHRANSYLHRVLEDREGLPISLSILYIELARLCGIPGVSGLGLPGHFIVMEKRGENERPKLIDPFNRGAEMSENEALDWVLQSGQGGKLEDYLKPVSSEDILVRVLNNLLQAESPANTPAQEIRYLQVMLMFRPDSGYHRLRLVQLLLGNNQPDEAEKHIRYLLEHDAGEFNTHRLRRLLEMIHE